ncbi:MAG: hydroxyisourate hydrolase [Polaromonas sp.]|nr:hydroxyisourate hydrolase [Polaromonas sp.]
MDANNTRRDFLAASIAAGGVLLATSQADAQTAAGGRVTAHVLDLYGGTPANGIKLDFYAYTGSTPALVKSVVTGADGRPPEGPLVLPTDMKAGRYRIDVHVADYYKKLGAKLPGGYHTRLSMEFDIYDAAQPHHLPFQITPWTQSSSVLPG